MAFPRLSHARDRALFEQFGSWPLIAGFVLVCAAEVVCGLLLWANKPAARWLAIALLPFELTYWLGFNLPFGPVGGVLRTAGILWSRRTS